MSHVNVEIKARSANQDEIRKLLNEKGAEFKGIDRQIDTYFQVPHGRLKLREGNIENSLIHYARNNQEGPKQSDVTLCETEPGTPLKELLTKALGVLVTVDKRREIYFIDNVKFHIDSVRDLGAFVEIEAIDKDGSVGKDKLTEQCQFYLDLFQIRNTNLVSSSYSDLLLRKAK